MKEKNEKQNTDTFSGVDDFIINEVDLENLRDDLTKIMDDLYFLDHPKGVELSDRVGHIIDDLYGMVYKINK